LSVVTQAQLLQPAGVMLVVGLLADDALFLV
jgi:hypothetical protein